MDFGKFTDKGKFAIKASMQDMGKQVAWKATMIASGGLSGGVSSAMAGCNFWDGMREGLIVAGLNHLRGEFLKKGTDQQGGGEQASSQQSSTTENSPFNGKGPLASFADAQSASSTSTKSSPLSLSNTSKLVGAIGTATDAKMAIMDMAGDMSKMGKTAATYSKIMKGVGLVGNIVGGGISGYEAWNYYEQEGASSLYNHRSALDAGVAATGVVTTGLALFGVVSNPVGWAVGATVAVYGASTFMYDIMTSK